MDGIDTDQLPAPGASAWQELCHIAETVFDADPGQYEQVWLPRVLPQLDGWPKGIRRCPDRWFRTRRKRVASLLRLGARETTDFGIRPPERFVDALSVSGVTAPDGWTAFTDSGVEFALAGDEVGPDPIGLQVAGFILDHWPEFEMTAEKLLNDVDSYWDDPYAHPPAPKGRPRFESSELVTVAAAPVGFTIHCEDHCHNVNGWPYGSWMVDFEWGTSVGVRVGTHDYNHPWAPIPRRGRS